MRISGMLAEVTFEKTLRPLFDNDREEAAKWRVGEVVEVKVRRSRNPAFHRKYFALLNYAFSVWEPEDLEYHGKAVGKNFKRFRKDIAILCGYWEPVTTITGEVRAEALSISFAKMEEDDFIKLYNKTIDVILKYILTNYTREDVDRVVANVLEFDK